MKIFKLLTFTLITFLLAAQNGQNSQVASDDEIIIRINHKYLKHEVVGDTHQQIFQLHHVLTNQGQNEFNLIPIPGLINQPIKKVFPILSWKDSISKTINGDDMSVPPFWATFILKVPQKKQYCKILKKLNEFPKIIEFAHPNYRIEKTAAPNDSLYYRQESLNGSAFLPNAGINIEEAWEIETGEPFVKIAVLDSGVDTTVADLDILFGGPYYNPIQSGNSFFLGYGVDEEGHGTQVAAIIGAKRNNEIGTAGVAGGNGADEEGVSLIDLRYPFVFDSGTSYLCAATVDAARRVGSYWTYPPDFYGGYYFENTPGFGVQIQNNSFVMRTDLPRCEEEFRPNPIEGDLVNIDEPVCNLCNEAYLYSYKSGVINVVSRGNSGMLSDNQPVTQVEKFYPQNFPDSWIISVGASGYDGTTVRDGINQGQIDALGDFYSLYGGRMDLIAPGSDSIVYGPMPTHFDETYRWFNGTSAAAPYVSGVVGLLLSHYNKPCYSNKNLAIEDVEYILQKSATDVLDPGFDEVSGAGRLNAGAALKMIENPTKQIVHPETLLSSEEISRDTISIKYSNAFAANGWGPISSDFPLTNNRNYQVVKVLYENTYSFAEYIAGSTELVDYWTRPSASNSIKEFVDTIYQYAFPVSNYIFDVFNIVPQISISNFDAINKTIKTQGYYYHFINQYMNLTPYSFEIDENVNINTWLPINPEIDTAKMPISLYIIDSLQTSWFDYLCDSANLPWDSTFVPNNGLNELNKESLKVYPNPSQEFTQIEFNNLLGLKKLELYDLKGSLIISFETTKNNYHLNLKDLQNGIYILKCLNQNTIYHFKILKE